MWDDGEGVGDDDTEMRSEGMWEYWEHFSAVNLELQIETIFQKFFYQNESQPKLSTKTPPKKGLPETSRFN